MIRINPELTILYREHCHLCNKDFAHIYSIDCANMLKSHLINAHNVSDESWAISIADIDTDRQTSDNAKLNHWSKIYDSSFLQRIIDDMEQQTKEVKDEDK